MPRFVARTALAEPADAVFAWHARPGALERLLPPWQAVQVEQRGGIRDGERVVLRMGAGPLAVRWVALHRDYQEGRQFRDEQVSGPFARWVHTHRFTPRPGGSWLEDEVDYELPAGALGARLGAGRVRSLLERMFRFRHLRVGDDLRRQAADAGRPRGAVAVTGATGLVGSQLCAFLGTAGHEVRRITRQPTPGSCDIAWDLRDGRIDAAGLEGVDAVVHLAGENVFGLRWTEVKRRAIRESRVRGTQLLARTLASLARPPRLLISASAVGYYGDRGDQLLTESSGPGEGFLAEVCQAWEAATEPAEKAGIRTLHLRIGVVLSARGGALATMLPPFRLGLGGRLGSGGQYMSWISLDDLIGVLHFLIGAGLAGPVNATAPEPVTNADFTRTLAGALHRPALLPVPALALRTALGQLADEMLLASARVAPAALAEAGFPFLHPLLGQALDLELGRVAAPDTEIEHA